MTSTADSFERCIEYVRIEEGGLVNHSMDPGKLTNFGITQPVLDASRAFLWTLPRSVEALSWPQAKEIYSHHYWTPVRGDELPFPYALMTLDAAVNAGVRAATRWLQMGLGVKVDGWIGAKTIQAATTIISRSVLAEMAARRAHHYMLQDSIDDAFGLGWARRLFRIYNAASEEIPR